MIKVKNTGVNLSGINSSLEKSIAAKTTRFFTHWIGRSDLMMLTTMLLKVKFIKFFYKSGKAYK